MSQNLDFSMLETHNDSQLSKIWNLPRHQISKLRREKGIKNPVKYLKNEKIINFIKNNQSVTSVKELAKRINVHVTKLTKHLILKLAKIHNPSFKIGRSEYEHNFSSYQKGCRCAICKLTNALRNFTYNHDINITVSVINKFANMNIDLYINDKSHNKRNFYKVFMEEIKINTTTLPEK